VPRRCRRLRVELVDTSARRIRANIEARSFASSFRGASKSLDITMSEAADQMIVHHTDRLHVSVHDGRSDES